ncbi:hypothetical protein V6N13_063854 [Hibiscus sabdariffa]
MFGNGRSESSPVGNSPIVIHLDASQVRPARILECVVKTRLLAKHQGTIRFISLHRIWDWGTIQFHLLHPLHVVKQMKKLLLKFIKDMEKENVDGLSFFGHKSEYVVSGSDNG